MKQQEIIQSLRAEITKLQQVLDLLLEGTTEVEPVLRRGRPKGSGGKRTRLNPEKLVLAKRTMSAEGKARIAAAQKKRWAAQKAATAKRSNKAVSSNSLLKGTPVAAKKNASTGKGVAPARARTQAAPAKRTVGVAKKKSAVKKSVAKKATRPATKQAAAPAPDTQATA